MDWHFGHTPKPDMLRRIKTLLHLEESLVRLRHARSPLHILIVEDDPVTQRLLHSLLAANYAVTMCNNSTDAINEYMRIMPDLVFLDVNLGERDYTGMDVLHTLHMCDRNATIVMLSANESPHYIAQAMREGAVGFIAKPFTKTQLLNHVHDCESSKARKGSAAWN